MTEETRPGIAVDAHGGAVVDPTKNVLDLVGAAITRQDDLRAASERRNDDLRKAAETLSNVKHAHLKETADLRARHSEQLNEAETKRIDAIRAVDVSAVGIATERAAAAAGVLATQVVQSAEALRVLVAQSATTLATQSDAQVKQLSDRIAQLERSSYEGTGKSAVADPAMARMVDTLEVLRTSMAQGQGQQASRVDSRSNVGMYAGIALAVLSLLSLIITVAVLLTKGG